MRFKSVCQSHPLLSIVPAGIIRALSSAEQRMEKSFTSLSNYFNRLRYKAREIDEGIERLAETWKSHLLIGGYAERTAETDAHLEKLWESIRSTDNAIEKFQSELEPSLEETDQLLEESQALYEDIKEKCDNLDIVLAEYGYHYEENNIGEENHSQNDSKDCTIHGEVEVEFTPDLTWKCKTKSRDSSSSNTNQKNSTIKGIATPVIKSLQSVLQSEAFYTKESFSDASIQESDHSKQITKI
ncbi:uncharacterized protein LOC105427076 [Pogonomyrmex barbatus]|uniref:Uncharacterized protein LOC105427076 n=1 Tax=Pogonomyrmex barbatus TaxID=144034 RepID=A0A6I9WD35_9HYME|nr:uncharacterized protein LOC105427076 [Pogonomyrmex barbatus]